MVLIVTRRRCRSAILIGLAAAATIPPKRIAALTKAEPAALTALPGAHLPSLVSYTDTRRIRREGAALLGGALRHMASCTIPMRLQ